MKETARFPAEMFIDSLVGHGRTTADLVQAMTEVRRLMAVMHLTHAEGRIFLSAVKASLDELKINA